MRVVENECRQPIEDFFRSHSIPIKLVNAQTIEEMSTSLIGRDAKVLAEKAAAIIPDVLDFVHAPREAVVAAVRESAQSAGAGTSRARSTGASEDDSVFTYVRRRGGCDDEDAEEGDEDDEEDDEDEDLDSRKLRYASYWDDFLRVRHALPACNFPSQARCETKQYSTLHYRLPVYSGDLRRSALRGGYEAVPRGARCSSVQFRYVMYSPARSGVCPCTRLIHTLS